MPQMKSNLDISERGKSLIIESKHKMVKNLEKVLSNTAWKEVCGLREGVPPKAEVGTRWSLGSFPTQTILLISYLFIFFFIVHPHF